MKEIIKENWDGQNIPKEFTEQIEKLSSSVNRLKSNAIFINIKRWMLLQSGIAIACCYFIYSNVNDVQLPRLATYTIAIMLVIQLTYYYKFVQKAELALAKDTKNSLESMINLLTNFIRGLKLGTIVLLPFIIALMLLAKTKLNDGLTYFDLPPTFVLVIITISLVSSALTMLFLTKVILPMSYSKWLQEYKDLYKSLTN